MLIIYNFGTDKDLQHTGSPFGGAEIESNPTNTGSNPDSFI